MTTTRGLSIPERIRALSIPEPNSGCWLWTSQTNTTRGYGQIWTAGQARPAHRVSYEAFVGPIPEGLLVCHKCDTRMCVNPDHLFVGTASDNMLDMYSKGRHRAGGFTHCKRGHAMASENVRIMPGQGNRRRCRTCERLTRRRLAAKGRHS